MADYHRFVAYIYEYVNGKKMQNTGFAKIELRNAICRIQIHIQNIRMLDGKTEVFGIVRQPKESRKNNPIILLIGEGQTQGSGFDRRFTVPEEPFVEEACRFEQVCGIYIRSQSGRNWMTVFDDEPIAIENLGKPEEIKAETDEENVKKSCFAAVTSSPVPQQPSETRLMELRIPKKQITTKMAQIIMVDIYIPPNVTLKKLIIFFTSFCVCFLRQVRCHLRSHLP